MNMKNTFIRTVLYYAKQFCLATFYGFRQWGFQMLCLIIMKCLKVNQTITYVWIVEGIIYGSLLFTMLFHWTGMLIPKRKAFVSFIVPYVLCVAMLFSWWWFVEQKEFPVCLLSGIASPFICLLFFLLEDYLKKLLTPHHRTLKGIKIVCNTITLLPFLLVVVLTIYFTMGEIWHRHRFDDAKTLTRITEVEFPKFKVVDYDRGGTSFHGDYSDELVLKFTEIPSEKFYTSIEALSDSTDWHIEGDSIYCYYRMWGNGMPAPKGEDDEEDMFLNIEIKRGEKQFHVSYGAW